MSNDFYIASGTPGTGAAGSSQPMRLEFSSIEDGFDKMPALTGNGNKAVVINAAGSAMTVTTGTLALAGNFATTGAFNTTLVQQATVSITLPAISGTLATLAGTETLTNKTLVAPVLGVATGTSLSVTGTLTAATGLNLSGTTSPLQLNGSAGTSGYYLQSAGAGATPVWAALSLAIDEGQAALYAGVYGL